MTSIEPETATPLPSLVRRSLTRRGFLRGAAVTGGGLVAASIAACAPTSRAGWTFTPSTPGASGAATPLPSPTALASAAAAAATPAPSVAASLAPASPAASSGPIPAGWTQHDVDARQVVRRYIGDLAPALKGIYGDAAFAKLAGILGADEAYPELSQKPAFVQVPQLVLNDLLQPLKPTLDGAVKVFDLTIDEIEQRIDELRPPVAALGYNKQWPGPDDPRHRRATRSGSTSPTTSRRPPASTSTASSSTTSSRTASRSSPRSRSRPGSTYTYEFTATTAGSLMYHSHHNATDQVGRGLLGAFIVDPVVDPVKYDREYVWISNDSLGGFTINGHGFPATVPVLAAVGETVRIRFMNEGDHDAPLAQPRLRHEDRRA